MQTGLRILYCLEIQVLVRAAGQDYASVQAAVARSFGKTVDIYDQDVHVRTLRTCIHVERKVYKEGNITAF
ncbi:hypothetical protein E5676_scaffold1163G00940 [Cucumis melo var. makuwa]|uniref:Uncharacterized protein n=1 Tax=Cucumis melo var. makuwa TaxID=1194695 RepID=A0A5D3DGM3_CUCMM|nr:hypothetical protein E5676_scaffold1163G00940 [Cucumis melo var. makuwa]